MEDSVWIEPGLGGPGRSEELGGSAGRQLMEPDASLRLEQGLGAHQRGQCSWEKPPQVCTWAPHPSQGPLTPALVMPVSWRGDRDPGSPSTDWTDGSPLELLGKCRWNHKQVAPGMLHRKHTQRRAEAKTSRSEGASIPFTEVSALSCPSRRPRRSGRSFLRDGAEGALTDPGKKSTPRWCTYSQVAISRPRRSPRHPHMSTKTMKHQPRPPTSSMVTWMP